MLPDGEKGIMYKNEEKKFDIRVVEKYIQEGSITPKQFTAYLENLADVSSNVDDEYHFELPLAHKKVKSESPAPSSREQTVSSQDEEA